RRARRALGRGGPRLPAAAPRRAPPPRGGTGRLLPEASGRVQGAAQLPHLAGLPPHRRRQDSKTPAAGERNRPMTRRTLEHAFAQDDFNRFAALSGDANPIHGDAAFAACTRFGRTVAHGVLLETVLRGRAAELAPGLTVTEQALRFSAPT